MARMAVISGVNVVNVIDADPGFKMPGFVLVQSDVAGPGWTYSGGVFTPPPSPGPYVPPEVSGWRAIAIMRFENLDSEILKTIAQMKDDAERTLAELAYNPGVIFERKNVILNKILKELGKTDEEIDEFFRRAAALAS